MADNTPPENDDFLDLEDELLEDELLEDGALDEILLDETTESDAELDEDWDAFDDDQNLTTPKAQPNPKAANPIAKYGFYAAIGVFVLGAGGLVLSQLGGSTPSQAPQQTVATAPTQTTEEPIEAKPSESSPQSQQAPSLDLASLRNTDEQQLAELPYLEELSQVEDFQDSTLQNNQAIEDLAANLSDEDDLFSDLTQSAAQDRANQIEQGLDTRPMLQSNTPVTSVAPQADENPLTPMPNFDNTDTIAEPIGTEVPVNLAEQLANEDISLEPINVIENANPLPVIDFESIDTAVNQITIDTDLVKENPAELVVETVSVAEQNNTSQNPALLNKISTLENEVSSLSKDNASLETKLADLKTEKQNLENQINSLQKDIARLEAMPKTEKATEANQSVKKTSPQTTKLKAIEKATTKKNNVAQRPVAKKPIIKTRNQQPIDWIMRSAQPGKAVIANASTGDLLRIEVGDTVQSLGVVKAISFNGRQWIIQGTEKSIVR